ncbi:hypothetical protein [Vibrio phage vB_VmeM-Yong XC32]|nr:hypothetical protein [Vibrio phage vB_VmeM-Yong XC31]QAX96598.1 hypothetical protein [Vibrio phage vB_VmeM-Yong XC32]QAX96916.1 hypothetical protein [Vibrio phage vB_VmeM-Yong MS31]QAX97221.1 hypothetical protein [Vibrio phage vB_VmeM-Yong MS32]
MSVYEDLMCKNCETHALSLDASYDMNGKEDDTISVFSCTNCHSVCRHTTQELNGVSETWITSSNHVLQLSAEKAETFFEEVALKKIHLEFINMNTPCTECEGGKMVPLFKHEPGRVELTKQCAKCNHIKPFISGEEELGEFVNTLLEIQNPATDILAMQIQVSLLGKEIERIGCPKCADERKDPFERVVNKGTLESPQMECSYHGQCLEDMKLGPDELSSIIRTDLARKKILKQAEKLDW